MKVLILTGSTGGGHNATAKSLQKLLNNENIENEIYDLFPKNGSFAIGNIYEKAVEYAPEIYRFIYKVSNSDMIKLYTKFQKNISEILYKKINEYKPEVVISTHPIAVPILKRFKRKGFKMDFKYIQVVTDFHPHKIYADNVVDYFITASTYTNILLAESGIKIYKSLNYGIPVDEKYLYTEKKSDLKHEITIMLGSMGISNDMKNIYDFIENNNNLVIHFITGNNKKLYDSLKEKYSKQVMEGKLIVYGFVDNVDEIMKKSDIIITKPGGLSLTECINLKKPMILVSPLPGQEEENLKIIESYGAGVSGINKSLKKIVNKIYKDSKIYDNMMKGVEKISKEYDNKKIIELIKNIL